MTCKGICTRYKAQKPVGTGRYASGQRRCQICEIFIKWEGLWCPCCGYRLRTKPRNLKYKAKLRARVNAEAKTESIAINEKTHFVGLLLDESRFSMTVVDIDKRSFTIQILLFDNGSFVSITECQEKIGGLTASIGTNTIPITTSIIPAKSESLFLKLISEQLSSIISGINIISAFIPKELENKTAKTLIAKIKEIVEK